MFTCISLELQVRTGSNLEDTIHDHIHSMPVRSAIMGRNGRVVLRAYFQNICGTFSLLKVYNSSHTFCSLCNLLQCCGTRSVFTNVNKSCVFFHYFLMFKRVWSQGPKFKYAVMSLGKASCFSKNLSVVSVIKHGG